MALLRERGARATASSVSRHVYGHSRAVGLRRDLTVPFEKRPAKVPITVRPLEPSEATLFEPGHADASESYEQRSRRQLLESGLGTCWAAVDDQGEVCYVQWLITQEQNVLLAEHFEGSFPPLSEEQALLEGAYTFPRFRGLKIMSFAMADIAERAADHGARWVTTYVAEGNEPSMRACRSAGFEPWCIREERWRLLRSHYGFEPVASIPRRRDRSSSRAR